MTTATLIMTGAGTIMATGIAIIGLQMLKTYLVVDRHPRWQHEECVWSNQEANEDRQMVEVSSAA